MGEGDVAVLGQDVVLRERDSLDDLLSQLPRKAQLGFSGLKEKWSGKSDKSLIKIISAAKGNEPLKVEYTCMDVDLDSITIGCNLGILFMYSRHSKTLSRFVCESKQVAIVCLKLLRNPNFIATGQFNGAVTIFQYEREKTGQMKVLLKCTVESHHEAPVTSIQWTHDGTKLFTADSGGNVAITVINMDEGKTHTVFICREESPVTQLAFSHTALLISTLQRTLIWPFNTKKVVQVGKQARKVFGNFGACFFPPSDRNNPADDDKLSIYAARPGLRLWKATAEGKVLTTMIFKDSVNKGEPIIETLSLPPHAPLPHQNELKQFGTLITFDGKFLVSWQGSSVWVMDPNTGYIIGCHSNLGYVTDVCACNNELYVLSKGDQNFVRKIVFETTIPCIVVEELDLNEETVEEEERRSVFQFSDDQDALDKLSSKMIDAICDVKSKVIMEIKPFLSGEGYSTSEGLSDIDQGLRHDDVTSDENNIDHTNKAFESSNELPRPLPEKQMVFNHLSHEAFPTDIVFEGTSTGRSPKRKKKCMSRQGKGPECIEEEVAMTSLNNLGDLANRLKDDNDDDDDEEFDDKAYQPKDYNFFVAVTKNEELTTDSEANECQDFVASSEEYCPDEKVEEGGQYMDGLHENDTSEKGTQAEDLVTEGKTDMDADGDMTHSTSVSNVRVFSVDHDENIITHADVVFNVGSGGVCDPVIAQVKETDIESADVDCPEEDNDVSLEPRIVSPTNGTARSNLGNDCSTELVNNDEPEFYFTVDESVSNSVIDTEDFCDRDRYSAVQKDVYTDPHESQSIDILDCGLKTEGSSSDERSCNATGPLTNSELEPSESLSHYTSPNAPSPLPTPPSPPVPSLIQPRSNLFEEGGIVSMSNINFNAERCVVASEIPIPAPNSELDYRTHKDQDSPSSTTASTELPQNNSSPSHVINVKISHQRHGSNASVASCGERCREVRGEAVETGKASPTLTNSSLLGEDDTLEANIHHPRDEHVSIDFNYDDSVEEGGKLYPVSPFPAPQMNNVYSQSSVALSEFSLNHVSDFDEHGYGEEDTCVFAGDYDRIDVHNDLIESLDSITDVEDNLCHTPPECISENEVNSTGPIKIKKRRLKSKHSSFSNSPCSSDLEGRPAQQQPVTADILQDRLRYLADSWARVELPTCRQIQFLSCSDTLVWVIDSNDHMFYAVAGAQNYAWKKLDGKAIQLATNQSGSVVWCIDRQKVAYYRTGIKENSPAGHGWEPFERNMHYVAVDYDRVWAIKTNGDVFVRTGVSMSQPWGIRSITVKIASDLVQITCLSGLVWALDIYNHVQIFTGSISSSSNQGADWCELPGISASHVCLGSKSVCWVIDREHGVWFNQDIAIDDDPLGGTWYQLSLGDGQSAEGGRFSAILNYFTEGNEPKMIVANEKAGTLILGKQGTVNVAHSHLFGTRWESKVPSQLSPTSWWSCITASGTDMNRGFIWALQPSGGLYCFKPGSQSFKVEPPNRAVLKYCSTGPRSLWALTAGQDVFMRLGISETLPQGLKWLKINLAGQESKRLLCISCGNHAVWGVDFFGNAWFQMRREEKRTGLEPAWVAVEGCPLDGNKFTKIAVGPDDRIVWACDDKDTVYARKDVTDGLWVGTTWEVVSGTSAKDVAISSNHVWALCPNGDVICRYGVSSNNVLGDYWKKVPGSLEQISVSPSDELWGIDRQGHLYQRETTLFYGSTLSNRAPSYNDLFSDHNDWEII